MIVDRAIYRDGERSAEPDTLAGLAAASRNGGAHRTVAPLMVT